MELASTRVMNSLYSLLFVSEESYFSVVSLLCCLRPRKTAGEAARKIIVVSYMSYEV